MSEVKLPPGIGTRARAFAAKLSLLCAEYDCDIYSDDDLHLHVHDRGSVQIYLLLSDDETREYTVEK